MRAAVLGGVLATLVTMSASASAQDAGDLARAEQAFKQALADEQAGQCDRAITELNEARTLARKETPQLLFHLGACHGRLGKVVLARDELRGALERAKAQGLDNVATTARALLDATAARVATVTLTRPARATVTGLTVDGADAASKLGAPMDLDPGDHEVEASYASGPAAKWRVTLRDGEKRDVAVPEPAGPGEGSEVVPPPPVLPGSVTPPGTVPPSPPPAPAPASSSGSRTLGWVLLGGGAALGVGGGVLWALRGSAISTLDGECGPTRQACPQSAQGQINSGKADDALGVMLFVAGGAAVLAGAGLLLFGGHSETTSGVRVTPVFSAHGAGVGLAGAL